MIEQQCFRLPITEHVIHALSNTHFDLPIGYMAYRRNYHLSVVIMKGEDLNTMPAINPYYRRYSPMQPNLSEEVALVVIAMLTQGIPYEIVLAEAPLILSYDDAQLESFNR